MRLIHFIAAFLLLSLVSCTKYKDLVYFQKNSTHKEKDSTSTKVNTTCLTYLPNDMVTITVSSIDPETTKPFNIFEGVQANNTDLNYLLNSEGMIDFPVLGKIKLGGLSNAEAVDTLKKKLIPYVKDPTINIRLTNFTITVLGDVKTPGSFTIKDEKVSVLEAIGLAGDLNTSGIRKNISIVRETNGKRELIELNLTDESMLNSDHFYLKQNDVVYVKPSKIKVRNENFGSSFNTIISLTAFVTSTVLILLLK